MRCIATLCSAVLLLVPGGRADADWTWNFDTGAEGWLIADLETSGPYHPPLAYYSLSHSTSGGNPGGQVYRHDPSVNSFAFSLPVETLPEGTQLAGGRLEYCLRSTHNNWTSESFVVFAGSVMTLLAPVSLPSSSWTSYAVDLVAANLQHEGGGAVSDADVQAVMGSLEGIYIMAEYGSGNVETSYLDSVRLREACPELAAPQLALQAVGAPDPLELTLNWAPVAGANSYEVLRRTTPWGPGQSLGVTTALQWGLPLGADSLGCFQVRARCN